MSGKLGIEGTYSVFLASLNNKYGPTTPRTRQSAAIFLGFDPESPSFMEMRLYTILFSACMYDTAHN
jgi:hypothetical protein